ncbi:hypothetical protein PoB_005337100 [Plakobranchus ocellatus]|uniref:Uncharacterized protein n=1 Tax=Plakobranchus ocellatus TaxID=259542 RepID=A0AAV4C678_9GAST|nr:hypothetical protein PoB_005337100 [Plakobranchus ocellatus]
MPAPAEPPVTAPSGSRPETVPPAPSVLPSGRGSDGGARTRDRRIPADLRADSQATVPPTPPRGMRKVTNLQTTLKNVFVVTESHLIVRFRMCFSPPKNGIYIHTIRRQNWNAEEANKLHEVLPNFGEDLGKRDVGAGRKRERVTHGSSTF